jgi:hypothetical protein
MVGPEYFVIMTGPMADRYGEELSMYRPGKVMKSVIATLAAIAFGAGATTATANAASVNPHASANCDETYHTGRFSQFWVCVQDKKMIYMEANDYLSPSILGHWEFRGPSGHLSNSADELWKPGDVYTLYNVNKTADPGSLWCVEFWVFVDGKWQGMENPQNCIII